MKEADSGKEKTRKETAKAISCRGDENLQAENSRDGVVVGWAGKNCRK